MFGLKMVAPGTDLPLHLLTKIPARTLETGDPPGSGGGDLPQDTPPLHVLLRGYCLCRKGAPSRKRLRQILGISKVPDADSVYRFLSRFEEDRFFSLITALLNSCCTCRRRRKCSTILIDGTAITLDLNWFQRGFSRTKQLEEREFRWGYAPSHGHYIGHKLTLAVGYPSFRPVGMILHPGSLHAAPPFEEILEELKRRRVIRIVDTVVCDKGYYAYGNYCMGILRFNIVPLIFPKKTFSEKKLLNKVHLSVEHLWPVRHPRTDPAVPFPGPGSPSSIEGTGPVPGYSVPHRRRVQNCEECILPEENPPLYHEIGGKGSISECTFNWTRDIIGIPGKETITEPRGVVKVEGVNVY
jgi:hypothetical protein